MRPIALSTLLAGLPAGPAVAAEPPPIVAPPAPPIGAPPPPAAPPIRVNAAWDVLVDPGQDLRAGYRAAGAHLAAWTIEIDGVAIDGPSLQLLADQSPDEPFQRVLREGLRRPVDPLDLLRLLDDVLAAGERRGERFHVTASRARELGAFVHPDEVWKDRTFGWPHGADTLAVDDPPPQSDFPTALDGEGPGPNWTMRWRSPTDRAEMFRTLAAANPGFAERVGALVTQLESQGVTVIPTSFLRYRERGYLMWGAFELARATDREQPAVLAKLRAANRSWAGQVPIDWSAPGAPAAIREAARRMADTYGVVYASEYGARHSHHYDGTAVDLVVHGLPRALALRGTDGVEATFDLADPAHPRDLNLEKELVAWVEEHFHLAKLRTDYPHWDDPDAE